MEAGGTREPCVGRPQFYRPGGRLRKENGRTETCLVGVYPGTTRNCPTSIEAITCSTRGASGASTSSRLLVARTTTIRSVRPARFCRCVVSVRCPGHSEPKARGRLLSSNTRMVCVPWCYAAGNSSACLANSRTATAWSLVTLGNSSTKWSRG